MPPSHPKDLQRPVAGVASVGTLGKMPAHPNDYRVDTTKLPQGGLLLKKTGWRKLRDDGNLRPGSKLMVAMEDSAVAMEVDALFAVADAQAAEEARAAEVKAGVVIITVCIRMLKFYTHPVRPLATPAPI